MSTDNSTKKEYDAAILEHANHPCHKGELENPDYVGTSRNNSCGDEITLFVKVKGNRFTEASWTGKGCAISQAAADILCCTLLLENSDNLLFDHIAEQTPGRIQCIETAFKALHGAPFPVMVALAQIF